MIRLAKSSKFKKLKTKIVDWFINCCSREKKEEYLNRHPIDDYIDEFWFINCPDD